MKAREGLKLRSAGKLYRVPCAPAGRFLSLVVRFLSLPTPLWYHANAFHAFLKYVLRGVGGVGVLMLTNDKHGPFHLALIVVHRDHVHVALIFVLRDHGLLRLGPHTPRNIAHRTASVVLLITYSLHQLLPPK